MNKGLMIVFIGTDGSGKTTIIDALPKYLMDNSLYYKISYYHWRPGYIVKKEQRKEGVRVEDPHAKPPYGFVKSFAKFMLINFDYLLGYQFEIKKKLKQGELVVFDRYFYDYYLDEARYRLSLKDSLIHMFQFMIPKPDMTFLLLGTPEVLYERKKEISVDEIHNQCNKIIKYEGYMAPTQKINVDKEVSIVVDRIGSWIVEQNRGRK